MTRQARSAFVLVVFIVMAHLPAYGGEFVSVANAIPGRYLVQFKSGAVTAAGEQAIPGLTVAEQARSLTFAHGGRVERVFEHAIRGFVFLGDEKAARALANDPRVQLVEPDHAADLLATQSLPHWGLDRIDERDRPRNNHFTYNTTGAGVNIYVIDTGINADAELGTRRVNAFTTITDAAGNPLYNDCNGHGTNVAKLAGGATSGVAKGATLHNVRVGSLCTADCAPGGDGGGPGGPRLLTVTGGCVLFTSDIITGMNWVAAHRVRPAVANVSLGSVPDAMLDNAVVGMHNAGVTVMVAAGNDGGDACNVSPARVAQAVTVGASDINDARAIFSSIQSSDTGACVDLFAPGKDLNGFSGTSAASPVAAGAAALYLQTNTLASPATVTSFMLNNATASRLTGIGSSPNRLLFVPPGGTEVDNPPVANSFQCSCNGGRTCTFTAGTYSDDFGISNCRYLVDYDLRNRPIYRYSCGTTTYTYKYEGPYTVDFSVIDDAGQSSAAVVKFCQ